MNTLACRDCITFYTQGESNIECYDNCDKLKKSLAEIEESDWPYNPNFNQFTRCPVHTDRGFGV